MNGYVQLRRLFAMLILTAMLAPAYGQTVQISKVMHFADKIFADSVKQYVTLKPIAREIRTTNKDGFYDYYEIKDYSKQSVPVSEEYLVTYKIYYPDLNFHSEIEILMNKAYRLEDPSAFENIPDYIKRNGMRDIITKDSAIKIAKVKGLASGDTLTVELFREYRTGQFFWSVESEWKSYYAKLGKEYKDKGGPRRRRGRPNDELFVNAKTGKTFTFNQMHHQDKL